MDFELKRTKETGATLVLLAMMFVAKVATSFFCEAAIVLAVGLICTFEQKAV